MKKLLTMLGTMGLMISPITTTTVVISCDDAEYNINDIDWTKVIDMNNSQLNEIIVDLKDEKSEILNWQEGIKITAMQKVHLIEYAITIDILEKLITYKDDNLQRNDIKKYIIKYIKITIASAEITIQFADWSKKDIKLFKICKKYFMFAILSL